MSRPYDLAALSLDDLNALVQKRPDLSKDVSDELDRRSDRFGVIKSGSLYGIAEQVTPQGHYITHQQWFETAEAAYTAIRRIKTKLARAELASLEKFDYSK